MPEAPRRPGRVAAGHERTAEVAAHLLREGGNAFDAVVAAGFAAAACEPVFTSLGGGGFCLARTASGETTLFDFFVDTPGRGARAAELEPHFHPAVVRFPAADQVFNVGLGSVAVPGVLAGLLRVHARLGRRPLAELVAPAARLAREGVALTPFQSYAVGLLHPILSVSEASRRLFLPRGRPPEAGERLANPELADFLERLPDDRGERFYAGPLARRIAADMRAGQGLVTEEDLAAYAAEGVVERAPLASDYRGHRLLSNPPPSRGGALVAFGLERLAGCAAPRAEAERSVALAEALEAMEARHAPGARPAATRGTTHVSVADGEGNAAALSSSNGESSGYVVPGAGIPMNNMLGEEDLHPEGFHASPPGERVASMMAPTLVLDERERVRLVLGSGGSSRIRTALLQVTSAVLDLELALRDAVEAPRMHWDGATLQVEPGLPARALEALRARFPLNLWPERNLYFGGVHAVAPGSAAAGDPRREGASRELA